MYRPIGRYRRLKRRKSTTSLNVTRRLLYVYFRTRRIFVCKSGAEWARNRTVLIGFHFRCEKNSQWWKTVWPVLITYDRFCRFHAVSKTHNSVMRRDRWTSHRDSKICRAMHTCVTASCGKNATTVLATTKRLLNWTVWLQLRSVVDLLWTYCIIFVQQNESLQQIEESWSEGSVLACRVQTEIFSNSMIRLRAGTTRDWLIKRNVAVIGQSTAGSNSRF